MSKHTDADGKLHVSKEVRAKFQPTSPPSNRENAAPQVPPKGTNANNQYR
jgi:hypothetical protein